MHLRIVIKYFLNKLEKKSDMLNVSLLLRPLSVWKRIDYQQKEHKVTRIQS